MAIPQMPIDGKLGREYKVTSAFGWRVHPVKKVKKHHNGVDIWGAANTIYIEAPFDGRVIFAGPSKTKNPDGSVGGFGYHVQIEFAFNGEWYVATLCHMREGSLKVKKGQRIEAGTVVGIMGATGMVTGKHLHWEITKGRKYKWTDNGVGFIDPITFTKAAIAFTKAKLSAAKATPDSDPVAPAPTHDEEQAEKIASEYAASKAAAKAI